MVMTGSFLTKKPMKNHRHTKSGRRDSNPRPPPWQGDVLPLNYFRKSLLSYFVESLQQCLIILVLLVRVNIKK